MSAKTTKPPTHTTPAARPTTGGPAATRRGGGSGSGVDPAHSIRTPWGKVSFTRSDLDARDPLEPDLPITERPPAGPWAADAGAQFGGVSGGCEAMSPRELYEMLMTPAANPTRSSPLRINPPVAAADRDPAAVGDGTALPPQAEMVLSALEAGQAAGPARPGDRRSLSRRAYRVRAVLRLFSDRPGTPGWTLYTRDVHTRGLGFITPHRLPLGYGGTVELPDPAGGDEPVRVPCTLLRCREAAPGWFEGSLYFNRDQPGFARE